jgi:hypothetical protein
MIFKPFLDFGKSFVSSELDHTEDLVEKSQKETDHCEDDNDRDHCDHQIKEQRKDYDHAGYDW